MVLSLENSINTGRGIPRVGPGVGPYTLSTRNYSICLYKNILTGKSNCSCTFQFPVVTKHSTPEFIRYLWIHLDSIVQPNSIGRWVLVNLRILFSLMMQVETIVSLRLIGKKLLRFPFPVVFLKNITTTHSWWVFFIFKVEKKDK